MDRKSCENGPLNRSTESIWTNLSWSTTGMDTLRATRPSNGLHRFLVQIRACDICGRLGGDEFLLVMSHGEEDATVQTIERLRADWEKERFVFNGRELQATACFGIAGYCGIENRTFVSCSPSQSRAIRS